MLYILMYVIYIMYICSYILFHCLCGSYIALKSYFICSCDYSKKNCNNIPEDYICKFIVEL